MAPFRTLRPRHCALALLGALSAACGPAAAPDETGSTGAIGGGGSDAAGDAGGSGGEPAGGGGFGPGAGTWEDPIVISALPFEVAGDTAAAPGSEADAYSPCAPDMPEGGGEIVYRVTVGATGWIEVGLAEAPGDEVDVDVHLLGAPSPESCWARDDVRVGMPVAPGDYWISVDTWSGGGGPPRPGPFVLGGALVTTADDCYSSPIYCEDGDAPYVNGVPLEAPGDPGCPAGMALVEDFCIDRYEAVLAQVLPGDALAPWSPFAHPEGATGRALSVAGAIPQGYVSQVQAQEACLAAGKRLCTDAEWLRACQGPDETTYPYGDAKQPGACNDARACHPAIQYFETDESWIWSELDHPCLNQLPAGLAAAGAHAGCASTEGAFDMMGNLHEWTADPAGTFRGGFYVDTAINGEGCLYATSAHNVWHWDYSTGFRCCADAG
ncbi:MAG: SUMF1/EgtB/PvdO family nonheme iron enzyme [Deltaproteobacteria bacterium]|nr:SUMF1/EgtB/PvdO family nonheme iron enzyme [Deltaproteobacteria bacterium]